MKLTFLIATRNRRESLARCLESIDALSWADRETIVVDDGSEDGTHEMLERDYPHVRRLRFPERQGVGAAYDRGLREATGQIVVNLDDDANLTREDSGDAIVAGFYADDVCALCFRVEAPDGSIRRREIPLRSKRLPTVDTDIGYFLGGAVAFRRTCLEAAGGYPVAIGYGSGELPTSYRLFKNGGRIVFKPGIRVVHHAIPSEHNTRDRQANYARSAIKIAAQYLPTPYAQVNATLWLGLCLALAIRDGSVGRTMQAARESLARWPRHRREHPEWKLTLAETRRLSALSGRTWY